MFFKYYQIYIEGWLFSIDTIFSKAGITNHAIKTSHPLQYIDLQTYVWSGRKSSLEACNFGFIAVIDILYSTFLNELFKWCSSLLFTCEIEIRSSQNIIKIYLYACL
jgi:hypothetical protein